MTLLDSLHVYVDGSFSPTTKTGGWAFVVYRGGIEVTSNCGRVAAPGNGQMEVLALLQALEWLEGSEIRERS
ncbi:RNase H family protein [Rhizobium sp. CNPSo 3464]|uniref:RNase H family protein n=1 Tax=Rhizobium sp. CNPSo 3464 TaxID=3021406 RepID=UPI003305CBF1